jgi:hypothetical protein
MRPSWSAAGTTLPSLHSAPLPELRHGASTSEALLAELVGTSAAAHGEEAQAELSSADAAALLAALLRRRGQ